MIYDGKCCCPIGKSLSLRWLHIPRQQLQPTNDREELDGKKKERERALGWRSVGSYISRPVKQATLFWSIHPPLRRQDLIYDLSPSHRLFSRLMKILFVYAGILSFSYSARVEEEGGAASERECTLRKPLHFSVTNDLWADPKLYAFTNGRSLLYSTMVKIDPFTKEKERRGKNEKKIYKNE